MLQGFFDGLDEEDAGVSMTLNGSEYETVSAEVTDTGMYVESEVETYSIELRDLGIVCVLGMITLIALFVIHMLMLLSQQLKYVKDMKLFIVSVYLDCQAKQKLILRN